MRQGTGAPANESQKDNKNTYCFDGIAEIPCSALEVGD